MAILILPCQCLPTIFAVPPENSTRWAPTCFPNPYYSDSDPALAPSGDHGGIDFDAYHYRTGGGAEVDLILEGTFGLVALEIKLGQRVRLQSLKGLRDFVKDHGCRFGLVLSNEEQPRMIHENIAGLPVRFL